jgi:hypothetical protein
MEKVRLMPRSVVRSLWGCHHVGLQVVFCLGDKRVVGDFTLAVILIGLEGFFGYSWSAQLVELALVYWECTGGVFALSN